MNHLYLEESLLTGEGGTILKTWEEEQRRKKIAWINLRLIQVSPATFLFPVLYF